MEITLNAQTPGEYIILEGSALTPKHPNVVDIRGAINAPQIYFEHRSFDPAKCYVLFDETNRRITLVADEHNPFGATVVGSFEEPPIIAEIGINTGKTWSSDDLGKYFRRNRHLFASKAEGSAVIDSLMSFQAKIATQTEKIVTTSGSKRNLLDQQVESNLPEKFLLKLPLFKGMEASELNIDLVCETRGTAIEIFLESPELTSDRNVICQGAFSNSGMYFEMKGVACIYK